MRIDASTVRAIAPGAKPSIVDGLVNSWSEMTEPAGITTPMRAAHFLAQLAHESAGFTTTTEFASGAAYENRTDLGNIEAGDGRRYKGRGLIQLTGRSNYRAFTTWARKLDAAAPDFEREPERAADFPWALLSAVWFWSTRGLNDHADADDVEAITRRINGGPNGLADRKAKLAAAKKALGVTAARPVLRSGDRGEDVFRLQTALNARGAGLNADGDFGPRTEAAVRRFQDSKGLFVDGIVGARTWAALGL